jgi:NTE family protein
VATDLGARREVWFQQGPVDVAIRASIAIPGVITPVMLNGRLLADGGILNPIPIAPTASVSTDATVAVSLAGAAMVAGPSVGAPVVESAEPGPVDEWVDRFRRNAANLLDRDSVRSVLARFGRHDDEEQPGPGPLEPDPTGVPPARTAPPGIALTGPESIGLEPIGSEPVDVPVAEGEPFGPLPAGLSKLDMMSRSLDAMQSVLLRYRLASYPPDVLVEVPKDAGRSVDFHRAAELIELGRTLTAEALDRAGFGTEDAASRDTGGDAASAPDDRA